LPKEEVANTFLSTGANKELWVRQVFRVQASGEVILASRRGIAFREKPGCSYNLCPPAVVKRETDGKPSGVVRRGYSLVNDVTRLRR
jgi:hypothetical protein